MWPKPEVNLCACAFTTSGVIGHTWSSLSDVWLTFHISTYQEDRTKTPNRVAIENDRYFGQTHTDRQTDRQTYTQVILYLSNAVHCIGQTIFDCCLIHRQLTMHCHLMLSEWCHSQVEIFLGLRIWAADKPNAVSLTNALGHVNNNNNKCVQSNLGRGPRRCESKSPLVTMVRPKFAPPPKYSFPWADPQSPPRASSFGPVRPMTPNGIRIRSAVFPQCTGQSDGPTHRPTDRPRENLMTIGRYASNESDAT